MVKTPVRVAGIGAWLSGAQGADALLTRLAAGEAAFEKLPSLRWDPDIFVDELPRDHACVELGASLGEVSVDWRTLKLPPLSVARMHTMEQVALVVMHDALRDAGIEPRMEIGERTRVYLAATTLAPDPRTDHGRRIRRHELAYSVRAALEETAPERALEVTEYVDSLFNLVAPPIEPDSMASSASILAGRVCNLFDIRGGHFAIDASTSSSLAALEAAVDDLRAGVCDVAVVGAVSPLLTASGMLAMAHRGILSAGLPRPFATDADGVLLGEGALAVVLDRGRGAPTTRARGWIEAVAGASLPQRGRNRLGEAITRATASALDEAGFEATRVSFVATRAAGIRAIEEPEAESIAGGYGAAARAEPLPIAVSASVFGHLSGASGMLALVQALLALEAGRLDAPTVPGVSLGPLVVGARAHPLPRDARAGVSDAGLAPRAYHAIVSAPSAHATPASIELVRSPFEPLAITGMGARVPGANDLPTFWSNVLSRVESIGDLPRSRWDVERFIGGSEELGAILKTRLAAPVELPNVDPAKHRLSPAAHAEVDPAVILSLDCAEQALTDSGGIGMWAPARVGVVSGQLSLRWAEAETEKRVLFAGHIALVREAMREASFSAEVVDAVVSRARALFDRTSPRLGGHTLAARTGLECAAHVARVWSLDGPALSIDAACASSLAALERAALSLQSRALDASVVVGVAFNLLPEYYVVLSILGALSPRGVPPFHFGADGFVPGEGAAAVVIERLADAEQRGAPIHGVIRGIGTSSDGAGASVFAPNGGGEQRAILRALNMASLTPRDIDLVEAHGTGTRLGDETEVHAYRATYGDRDPGMPLTVGTVKSQVGHLSSAAGMVGLLKATMAVRSGVLPPTLGEHPAPDLELERGPLRLPADARPWVVPAGRRRRAGVSAFGLGGVNYHVLVEQPPRQETTGTLRALPQAQRPARSPRADRFAVELVPLSLGARAPRTPLRDRVVWVIPDRGSLVNAVGAALEQRGARVVVVRSLEEAARAPEADGIIDLSAFGRSAESVLDPALDARASERTQRALAILRPMYDRFAAAAAGRSFYVAVTSLGGDLGLTGASGGDLAGAALLGLAKGLKQELPRTASRGIDFSPGAAPDSVAEHVAREIEDGNDQLEVAYGARRFVTRLKRLPFDSEQPLRPIRREDVIVVSGGGRGVVFECATALARFGARVVVCGRTPAPPSSAPWLDLDEEAFAAYAREHMLRRKRETKGIAARVLKSEIDAMKRARELSQNLRRAERDRLSLEYVECDVLDAASVKGMVDSVRRRHGPITGIAHGAMVQWSTIAARKEPDRIDATLRVKSAALATLLDATADDPVSVVLCFGSGAGRFGNRGQADYCAANALMAARLAAARRLDVRGARFVTVDWTAWDQVGAAVEDPDLAELLKATGITSISVDEGTYWFLREWTAGTSPEVVVFEERMLHDWPFLGRQAESDEVGRVEVDDLGRPLVPGAWPMVDRVLERAPRSIVVERRLDVGLDAFIDQHRLHGVPILPATFGCELLAEVAALLSPGQEIEAAYDIRIETPTKLFRERPLIVRARAERDGDGTIRCETRSRLTLHGREVEQRVHHSGTFRLRPEGGEAPRSVSFDELAGSARARSFFHMARDPVTLGPLYCRGQWIQLGDRQVLGMARAPRERDATSRTAWPLFQVDPLIMDTAFQIAANWDGFGHGFVSIPFGIAELRMGRRRRRAEDVRVRAVVTAVNDPDVHYDIDVASEDGQLLMEIRGLHLRRVASTGLSR